MTCIRVLVFVFTVIFVAAIVGAQGSSTRPADEAQTRRAVKVDIKPPVGSLPIKGEVLKCEVIEAIDQKTESGHRLKIVVRVKSMRKATLSGRLQLFFHGKKMHSESPIKLLDGQSDLLIFWCSSNGNQAKELSKLTAELTETKLLD